MEQVFVIGDVHGEYDMFRSILKNFQPDEQQLNLIGDLNDRANEVSNLEKVVWFYVHS